MHIGGVGATWIALALALALSGTALADEADAEGVRIENEFKLAVPDAQLEAVRDYLRTRYTGESGILSELGGDFSAAISDEWFRDRYFDTQTLAVLAARSGVRARLRMNLDADAQDRKHGRELLQIKLNRSTNPDDLNRSEIKFDVEPGNGPFAAHPLLGLVDDADASPLLDTLRRELDVDGEDLRPTITLTQRRWRVYVSRKGSPFATLTLDEVASRWFLWSVSFVELEIELNEIAYTDATPAERDAMQRISQTMKDDLLAAFPAIVQDQTPKYNKAFQALSARVPGFASLAPYGELVDAVLVLSVIPVVGLVVWLASRLARRRQHAQRSQQGREQVW